MMQTEEKIFSLNKILLSLRYMPHQSSILTRRLASWDLPATRYFILIENFIKRVKREKAAPPAISQSDLAGTAREIFRTET